ncbi:MAG TPA: hypothetical protein VIX20_07915, partial [Ktedonobacteraceae bacterium]
LLCCLAYRSHHEAVSFFRVLMASSMPSHPPPCLVSVLSSYLNRIGVCPKNRFIETPDGESGLNYLCVGYKAFFTHINKPMRIMAELLRRDRAPAEVQLVLAAEEAQ